VQNPDGSPAVEEVKPVNPRYAPIIVFSGGDGGASIQGVGYKNNIMRIKKNPLEELAETQPGVTATYITDRPHTIAQGKLLNAILETAINTEVPGTVRAVVSRDVYGEAGSQVLIPKGSRLFGSYTSQIQRGQGRVQINWTRLIRPDGVDLAISFNASDQFGRSGIPGEVDNKYSSIVANSLLTSVIAVAATAAAQSLVSDTASTTTTNATQGTTTVTADATNQAINNVSGAIVNTVSQIVNNALDVTPIIRVPQGTRITVIVNADIKVPFIDGRER
jgi:type IV secretion system protein VirB10